jgi:hypothetical protein
LGFEIAMHDPFFVRCFERLRDLSRDVQRLIEGHGTGRHSFGKGRSLDQFHDQGAHAIGLFKSVNRGNVGVLELGEDLGLALEARQPVGISGEFRRQDLEGDLSPELAVSGAVNLPHATGTERSQDLVGSQPGAGGQAHRCLRRPGLETREAFRHVQGQPVAEHISAADSTRVGPCATD